MRIMQRYCIISKSIPKLIFIVSVGRVINPEPKSPTRLHPWMVFISRFETDLDKFAETAARRITPDVVSQCTGAVINQGYC